MLLNFKIKQTIFDDYKIKFRKFSTLKAKYKQALLFKKTKGLLMLSKNQIKAFLGHTC